MLIASKEVVGLRRVLKTALHQGASASAIVELIEKSIAGLYSPRGGFTDCDIDVAFLVKAIGGLCLLYALQKAHGLASCSTLQRQITIPNLLSSIGQPSPKEVGQNIAAFLHPDIKLPPPKTTSGEIPGNILMFDNIALEMRCQYCSQWNQIVGLCWEHSKNVNTFVNNFESIEKVSTALSESDSDSEKVCFGANVTVVAITPYAQDNQSRLLYLHQTRLKKATSLPNGSKLFWKHIRPILMDLFSMGQFGH